jgi:hypothetical protein
MVARVSWLTTAQGQLRSVAGYMATHYSFQVAEKFVEEESLWYVRRKIF